MPKFLQQVRRVLRPGGHFLFADLRSAADRDRLHRDILECGMTLLEQEDITANVLAALRCESARKLALIEQAVNQHLQNAFRQFAAVEGRKSMMDSGRERPSIFAISCKGRGNRCPGHHYQPASNDHCQPSTTLCRRR